MAHDDLALLQELIGDAYALAQQPAGVLAQIKNQPSNIATLFQCLGDFVLGSLLKAGDVHVADARLDHEVQVDAEAGNLVTSDVEVERLLRAFAQNGDLYGCAFGALEQFGNVAGAQVVGGFAVNRNDYVARTYTGAIGRGPHEGRDHDDLIVSRSHRHAHAVVLSALLFAQQGVRLGIEKVGVRIEHAQHAGNGPVVDGLLRVHRLGIVLLHQLVNLRKGAQAIVEVRDPRCRGAGADLLTEERPSEAAEDYDNGNVQKRAEGAARAARHREYFLCCGRPTFALGLVAICRSIARPLSPTCDQKSARLRAI